jgi:integrase
MSNTVFGEQGQLRLFDFGGADLVKLQELERALSGSPKQAGLTVRGYASDLRVFGSWCREFDRVSLPASADTLKKYAIWSLLEKKRRVTTVNRHLAAILDAHKQAKLPAPSVAEARAVVAEVQQDRGEQPQGKTALRKDDLLRIAQSCSRKTNAGLRDRAILILGFATTLRRSNLARLQLKDVTFDDGGRLVIFVRKSKTDQKSKGRRIAVWPGKRTATDPVRVLADWIKARGSWQGPLFCRIQTGDQLTSDGISGESVNDIVKRLVAGVGLDPDLYGAHSLRAGAITASAQLGRSDQEIMGLSGHESPAVMRMYIDRERLFAGRNPLAGVL